MIVWKADSTLAKFPFPNVTPENTYLPIHLSLDPPELPLLCCEGGLGGGASSLPLPPFEP